MWNGKAQPKENHKGGNSGHRERDEPPPQAAEQGNRTRDQQGPTSAPL